MTTTGKHLLVIPTLSAEPFAAISAAVTAHGLDPARAHLLSALDGFSAPGCASAIATVNTPPGWHTPDVIATLLTTLAPGGTLRAGGALAGGGATRFGAPSREDLIVAGFADAVVDAVSGVVVATKPTWKPGAAFALKTRKQKENVGPGNDARARANGAAGDAWKIAAEDADELMDEDALLDEDELRAGADAAAAAKAAGDCSTSAKACKNCSCGRAEMEAAGDGDAGGEGSGSAPKKELTEEEKKNFKSACGNCDLGDAFRCAGCPKLGQPATAKLGGTKVTVNMADDLPF